jgi:transcriptional regulator with XRE-family HTH domain
MDKSIYTREYAVVLRLLRQCRDEAQLTQVDLARKLRQSQSFVSKIECGDRRLDIVQLRTICRVLRIELAEFVRRFEQELAKKS